MFRKAFYVFRGAESHITGKHCIFKREEPMLIKKPAVCGTLESSDVQITIRPNEGNGIRIELDSVVKTIFGDEIIRTVQDVLNEFEVRDADISLVDKGALDCVIRSRMQAVILSNTTGRRRTRYGKQHKRGCRKNREKERLKKDVSLRQRLQPG